MSKDNTKEVYVDFCRLYLTWPKRVTTNWLRHRQVMGTALLFDKPRIASHARIACYQGEQRVSFPHLSSFIFIFIFIIRLPLRCSLTPLVPTQASRSFCSKIPIGEGGGDIDGRSVSVFLTSYHTSISGHKSSTMVSFSLTHTLVDLPTPPPSRDL